MKRSVLITLAVILVTMTFTQCLSADTDVIDVIMNIEAVATINVNNAVIELLPVSGSMDYEGVTSPNPYIVCNVPVTVTATTVGSAPLVSTDWQTKLQGKDYNGTPDATPIDVDPPSATVGSPFYFGVAVKAGNVNMTARGDSAGGPPAIVAQTTVTVLPRP